MALLNLHDVPVGMLPRRMQEEKHFVEQLQAKLRQAMRCLKAIAPLVSLKDVDLAPWSKPRGEAGGPCQTHRNGVDGWDSPLPSFGLPEETGNIWESWNCPDVEQ